MGGEVDVCPILTLQRRSEDGLGVVLRASVLVYTGDER
jgi:hypothetical protein